MSQFFLLGVLVAIGGAIGGAVRMLLSERLAVNVRLNRLPAHFPYPTCCINLIGCLLIGALVYWQQTHPQAAFFWALLAVGLVGALTTVSTFALEVASLIRDRRLEVASAYIIVSMVACPGAVFLGQWLAMLVLGGSA